MELKLNNKRTILVGLAFLSISAFWQMYDSVMTLILTGTFQLNETVSGAIMAADNVLALFLLPLFGAISDRTETRIGRRMPFILGGTAAAAVLMNLLPMLDNQYANHPSPATLAGFVAVLALLLVAMGTYRSPAVALMPDVTPKPLRSKGNAIINLMGAVGGILYLAVAAVMYPTSRTEEAAHVDYQPLFLVVSLIMAAAVVVLFLTVREPKLAEENRRLEAAHPEWDLAEDDGSGHETLPAPVKRSLGFLLVSISLWFIAYNGVTTWFTRYVAEVMGEGLGGASTCLLVATAGAIVSYIPVGVIASKIGRKRTIMAGIVLLALAVLLDGRVSDALGGMLCGMGSGLLALSGSTLLNLRHEAKHPEMARQHDIEQKDERNVAIRNRAKAVSGEALQWSVLAAAWLSIGLDAPLWVPLAATGVFVAKSVLELYLMVRYEREM